VNQWICGHIWICEGGSVTEDDVMHLRGCAVSSVGRQSECGAVCEWVDGRERQGREEERERERRDYQSAVGFELR
jgi:hypothetical protein